MQVQVNSAVALSGMLVSMTTPPFLATIPHCMTFDYEMKSSDGTPMLEIHTRFTDYMLSGIRIWSSGNYSSQYNKARITVSAAGNPSNLPYVLDFVGIVADPVSTLIRIGNVNFLEGHCEHDAFFADDGGSGIVMLEYTVTSVNKLISFCYFITKATDCLLHFNWFRSFWNESRFGKIFTNIKIGSRIF